MNEFNDDSLNLRNRIRYSLEAMGRRVYPAPRFEHLQAWIVSPGGVGTTFLLEYIGKFLRVNNPYDHDDLKHWPKAPTYRLKKANIPTLFISGEPEVIANSLARRRWIRIQSRKLGSPISTLTDGKIQRTHFIGAVKRQCESWRLDNSGCVMFVNYEDLWNLQDEIAGHLGISNSSFIETFPKRRSRNAS